MSKITKIFIANRAEIASRIIRTAHQMGISCIVPYTWVDKDMPFVAEADVACLLLENPATAYLNGENLIKLAKEHGADAIHPGYGFLSENAAFAQLCEKEGITFIGPSAKHIDLAGDKAKAKEKMASLGLPTLPSYLLKNNTPINQNEEQIIKTVGFPCILKPVAGGGGKGMHLISSEDALAEGIERAKREAQNIFGDATLLAEKFCQNPRHIEVQVFGDTHGNAVHLFERNCSLQRRHQKIIEEAKSPALKDTTRQKLYADSIQAVKGMEYVNAGTMEFLVDANENIYFLEMNTRLQVEHPVTEMITGQDLVAWQIKIAEGEKLPLEQSQIKAHGHAIEGRLYAEDPANNFQPSIGTIHVFNGPANTTSHRLDQGYKENIDVTPYYDPMMAKIIVWGEDRQVCLQNFKQALSAYHIYGVTTNLPLLEKAIALPDFVQGDYTTKSLDILVDSLNAAQTQPPTLDSVWQVANHHATQLSPDTHNIWQHDAPLLFWLHHPDTKTTYKIEIDTDTCRINDENYTPSKSAKDLPLYAVPDGYVLFDGYTPLFFATAFLDRTFESDQIGNVIKAPLPGTIRHVFVKPGESVKRNTPLITLEAMKTEYVFKAPQDLTIDAVNTEVDQFVQEGTELVRW